jgi:hypothetical protein
MPADAIYWLILIVFFLSFKVDHHLSVSGLFLRRPSELLVFRDLRQILK